MPRPVHFEIPAENPERAMAFYENVFGWKFQKWEGPAQYWTITTGPESEPGINGGLLLRRDPNQPCVNTVMVTNLEQIIVEVAVNGGECVIPKMAVPGVGWLAYFRDTEGHFFGAMQADPSAVQE